MKNCRQCEVEYEPYGQRCSLCRDCKRAYDRAYHAARTAEGKERKLTLQRTRLAENRQKIWDFLLSHPCEVCGEKDPIVLEFDHLDPSTKHKAVAEMLCNSWVKIEAEIAKCRVLCANCHRRHTAAQLGWYKLLV